MVLLFLGQEASWWGWSRRPSRFGCTVDLRAIIWYSLGSRRERWFQILSLTVQFEFPAVLEQPMRSLVPQHSRNLAWRIGPLGAADWLEILEPSGGTLLEASPMIPLEAKHYVLVHITIL